MGKHSPHRATRRGLVITSVALASGFALTGLAGASSTAGSTQPLTGPGTAACKNAQEAFKQAQADFVAAKKAEELNRNKLRKEIAEAKADLAKLPKTVTVPDPTDTTPPIATIEIPNPLIAKYQARIDALQERLDNLKDVRDLRDEAKAARDRACAPPVVVPTTPPPTSSTPPPVTTPPVDVDCDDFATRAEAQEIYNKYPGDPYKLDTDGDGIACERKEGDRKTVKRQIILAEVVLARDVCGQVEIEASSNHLVRVVKRLPCPADCPEPPADYVDPGEFVSQTYYLPSRKTTTYESAPVPETVESDLAVTH